MQLFERAMCPLIQQSRLKAEFPVEYDSRFSIFVSNQPIYHQRCSSLEIFNIFSCFSSTMTVWFSLNILIQLFPAAAGSCFQQTSCDKPSAHYLPAQDNKVSDWLVDKVEHLEHLRVGGYQNSSGGHKLDNNVMIMLLCLVDIYIGCKTCYTTYQACVFLVSSPRRLKTI